MPVVGRQERCDHRLRGHRQLAQPPLGGNPPGGGGADQQRCFRAFQRIRQTLVELVWLQHGPEEHMGIEQQRSRLRAMAPEWAVLTLAETPAAAECSIHA